VRSFSIFAVIALSSSASAGPAEERGLELAKQANAANAGYKSERSAITVELINAHGEITKCRMMMETIEGVGSEGDKSRVIIEWPEDIKGTTLLTVSHKHVADEQWLYLPALKRTKRISSSHRSRSFMGSEFAFEDLGGQQVERFAHTYLDEAEEQGRPCWRYERRPLEKDSGYVRQVVYLDKEYWSPLKIEYYDLKNELIKISVFSGYTKLGKFWRFSRIDARNVQTKRRSVLTWDKRELGVPLAPASFDLAEHEN